MAEPQPSSLPRSSARTRQKSETEKVTSPPQSIRVAFGSRDSASFVIVADDAGEADRHVQQEDRLPAERVGERAADQRPDRDGAADRRPVDAERGAALAPAGELLGDQGERDGEHDRAADSLERARDVEEGRVRRERAEQRGRREDRQADHEDAAAAEPVGERAGGEDEGRERERVGVDHPLEVGEARAEVLLDRRQGGVHHGDVEQQHERGHADREQGPPLALHRGATLPAAPRPPRRARPRGPLPRARPGRARVPARAPRRSSSPGGRSSPRGPPRGRPRGRRGCAPAGSRR